MFEKDLFIIAIVVSIAITIILSLMLFYTTKKKKANKLLVPMTRAVILSEASIVIKTIDNFRAVLLLDSINSEYTTLLLLRIKNITKKIKYDCDIFSSIESIEVLLLKLKTANVKQKILILKTIDNHICMIKFKLKNI